MWILFEFEDAILVRFLRSGFECMLNDKCLNYQSAHISRRFFFVMYNILFCAISSCSGLLSSRSIVYWSSIHARQSFAKFSSLFIKYRFVLKERAAVRVNILLSCLLKVPTVNTCLPRFNYKSINGKAV